MIDLRTPFDVVKPELKRLDSCDDMVRGGMSRHFATGDHLLLWSVRSDLCGLALWGRMSFAQLRLLERVFDRGARGGMARRCDFVLDARRVHGLDSELYEGLTQAATRRLTDIRRRVRRQALLRSSGLIGGAVSGFYATVGEALEWRVFTELAPALAWLDEPEPDALAARLDRLVAEAISGSTLLHRLREALATAGARTMLLGDVSRSLGISGRSLQRALRELGTSFREELYRARAELAKKLLLETDHKIAAIGERVGFSTESNFITFFRRATGESPAAWRRENRHPVRADAGC
jgi:AraC-like DNA-binding protein